jgi:uncharacterized protein YggE
MTHRILVAALAAILMAAPATGQTTSPTPNEPLVVVTGEGLVKLPPDRAFVTFSVESRSKNPKDAQAQNAKTMATVQERLMAARVAKDAIRTLSYDLNLESDWVNGRQVPRGYVARNTIEVRLDDITLVGEIIDVAITSGANAVHNVRFDLKDRDAAERSALKIATSDARARAQAAAEGVGATIGRVVRIEEPTGYRVPPPMPVMREAMARDAQAAPTPIVAGEIEIRAAVVLTATLK